MDTPSFSGPAANYTIDIVGDLVIVTDNVGTDGVDALRNIELLQFADGDYACRQCGPRA